MPRRKRGKKRRANASGNADMIAKIATGEIEDIATEYGKNTAAGAHGRTPPTHWEPRSHKSVNHPHW
jgi:hypothetical protein